MLADEIQTVLFTRRRTTERELDRQALVETPHCPSCKAVFLNPGKVCPNDGTTVEFSPLDPVIGSTVGNRYQVEKFLAAGGMGRVYQVRHKTLNRRFAVKFLYGDLVADTSMRVRFAQEAEASSRLSHPNLVSVVDLGNTVSDIPYLVMDLVTGVELGELILREKGLSEARCIEISKQLCAGLQHAHGQGVIHRDFKPPNVIVNSQGGQDYVRIIDFGLACILGRDTRITSSGMAIGTISHMSPEQLQGERGDERSDLFSLGITMFQMLSGQLPFDGSPSELARHNKDTPIPRLHTRKPGLKISPRLEAIIGRLTEKSPARRYGTAREVMSALNAVAKTPRQHAGFMPALR